MEGIGSLGRCALLRCCCRYNEASAAAPARQTAAMWPWPVQHGTQGRCNTLLHGSCANHCFIRLHMHTMLSEGQGCCHDTPSVALGREIASLPLQSLDVSGRICKRTASLFMCLLCRVMAAHPPAQARGAIPYSSSMEAQLEVRSDFQADATTKLRALGTGTKCVLAAARQTIHLSVKQTASTVTAVKTAATVGAHLMA